MLDGKKDFSCSDRKFAANISITFNLPEEYFLGEPPSTNYSWYGFNPHPYPCSDEGPLLEPEDSPITTDDQEMVIFVGCPAAGKTQFYDSYMKRSYYHISRDRLGSWQKCVSESQTALAAGKSVVIDNTSPDVETRGRYIQIAQQYKVPVRCMLFLTSISHAIHNNNFRNHTDPHYNRKVPLLAIRQYETKFIEPVLKEGFSKIIKIKIRLRFTDSKLKELYMQFF